MLAAHRYLNTQLAQQSEGGASALAWALSHATANPVEQTALADELFEQGLYALVRIADDRGAVLAEQQKRPGAASRDGDWRNAWLSVQAPAVSRPFTYAAGARHAVARRRKDLGAGVGGGGVLGAIRLESGPVDRSPDLARHLRTRAYP
ncbi:hypothetical protein G6F22_018319 [Rhizopus arrhizus]|nr:hypothetical protein G6F22_018319 [Rhizopus arrhizus]